MKRTVFFFVALFHIFSLKIIELIENRAQWTHNKRTIIIKWWLFLFALILFLFKTSINIFLTMMSGHKAQPSCRNTKLYDRYDPDINLDNIVQSRIICVWAKAIVRVCVCSLCIQLSINRCICRSAWDSALCTCPCSIVWQFDVCSNFAFFSLHEFWYLHCGSESVWVFVLLLIMD